MQAPAPLTLRVPPRKRGPPTPLTIGIDSTQSVVLPANSDLSASTLDSAASEASNDFFPFRPAQPRARSLRNQKSLSLTLSSAQSSTNSLQLPPSEPQSAATSALPDSSGSDRFSKRPELLPTDRVTRRTSVASLPTTGTSLTSLLSRKEEDGISGEPYPNGPIQILPGIWLGSEANARDWKHLIDIGVKAILNVAKEVNSPFDAPAATPLRQFASTPNLSLQSALPAAASTLCPPHVPSGRPSMHYLKLDWSHGQSDLVKVGIPQAITFVDAGLERGEGVLIHCQCGVSRSATLVIALVMRAAAISSSAVPPEVWTLKGYQAAYAYVKQKSSVVGPNMSLIYQLLEYERQLKSGGISPTGSDRSSMIAEDEEEWGRRRRELDEADSEPEDNEHENEVKREAEALDRAMEERISTVGRKTSISSIGSTGSGVGMGVVWRSRYGSGAGRKRAGSMASTGSVLSEDLVEEDESQELLGTGCNFDDGSLGRASPSSSADSPPGESDAQEVPIKFTSPFTPRTARPPPSRKSLNLPPPSAPVSRTQFKLPPIPASATWSSFNLPPVPVSAARSTFNLPPPSATRSSFNLPPIPRSAIRSSFDLPPVPASATRASFDLGSHRTPTQAKGRKRPPPLGLLPSVPDSPIHAVAGAVARVPKSVDVPEIQVSSPTAIPVLPRTRTQSRRPPPPPLHLRQSPPKSTGFTLASSGSSCSLSSSITSSRSTTSSGSQSLSLEHKYAPKTPRNRTSHVTSSTPLQTPSQTLFVFPPSPTLTARTPSTMTLNSQVPFPSLSSTPRVSTFRGAQGKTRSFIGLGAPATPTTACSRVDARGWFGGE